jgi:hypothetical protein
LVTKRLSLVFALDAKTEAAARGNSWHRAESTVLFHALCGPGVSQRAGP